MLKKWKSLFIRDESEDAKKKEEEEEAALDESIEMAENLLEEFEDFDDFEKELEQALSGEVFDKEGKVDNQIIEKLLEEVEKNNQEGFDYFEYKKSLKALEKMPMNEVTKYRSAFATASTMGVTLQTLVDSANFYLNILNKQNEKITSEFDKVIKKEVEGKENKIVKLKTSIQEKKAMIKKLTEEISEHEKEITDMKYAVKDSKKEISESQNNFKVSFEFLKSEFTRDIARMKEYLK
jgi:hypothetical protein